MVLAGVISITIILTLTIDWTAKYIPFSFEQALVSSSDEIFDNERNEVDDYLQSLTDKIITSAELPDDFSITVHYVDEDTVNAGATLGGNILVYRGLLEKIPDENTLVMLLGHEIGHVKLRHPVQALGKGVAIGMVLAAALGQSSDSVASLMSDTSMIAVLSFSREQEEDSDEEGLKILNSYYGHTQGSTTLFEILKNEEATNDGYKESEFLSSHPLTENRIQHIKEITSIQQWTIRGEMRAIPVNIRKKLAYDKEQENADSNE